MVAPHLRIVLILALAISAAPGCGNRRLRAVEKTASRAEVRGDYQDIRNYLVRVERALETPLAHEPTELDAVHAHADRAIALAASFRGDPGDRSNLLVHAALVWMGLGEPERAHEAVIAAHRTLPTLHTGTALLNAARRA